MCNQVLQEQIVATVKSHVRWQEISEVQVVEPIQVPQTTLSTSSTSISSGVPARHMPRPPLLPPMTILFHRFWTTNRCLVIKHKSTKLCTCSRRRRRILHGTRSRLFLFSSVRLAQPPATGASGRNWLMRIPNSSYTTVKSCKLPRNSWLHPCESCKRNANIVLHKTLRRPRGKIRGTNTNIVAPVRFCAAYISSLSSQRGRLLRMFQSTAFHRFGLLPRAQFDCQLLRKRPRTHLKTQLRTNR